MVEYLAVVLAGYGNRLYPLVDDSLPKALLPVANKPMITHTLGWLETNGFSDILVIVNTRSSSRIFNLINRSQYLKHNENTHIELYAIDDYPGTASLFRSIRDKIRGDLFVCSCDIIATVPLEKMVNLHRTNGAALTALFYTKDPEQTAEAVLGARPDQSVEYCDVVGLDEQETRLLYFASDTDMEENFQIEMPLLRTYGMVNLKSGLLDAHAYLIQKGVIDLLLDSPDCSFYSVKEDWIPFIVRNQAKLGPCFAHIVSDVGQCARVNTLANYLEVNRLKSKQVPEELRIPQSVTLSKCQVGSECLVGENTVVEEKSSIKRSIIGPNCKIGSGVKMNNCILMDHVTVEPGCKLENVIVACRAVVGEKCNLKDCDIACAVTVERDTLAKGDLFTNL